MRTETNKAGGYSFIPDIRAFSLGVIAEDGYCIVRASLSARTPLAELPSVVNSVLADYDRPPQALCGVELRSPNPMSQQEFDRFNEDYATTLDALEITIDGTNPVARTNVVPLLNPVSECEIHAISFTVPRANAGGDYVLAGAAELDDCSTVEARVVSVLEQLKNRITSLGSTRRPTVAAVYSADGVDRAMVEQIGAGLGQSELRVTIAHPPVKGLKFEMDARAIDTGVLV